MRKLKLKSVIIPLIALAFLTGCNGGNVPPEPTVFTIFTNSSGIKIRPNTATEGKDYVGTIIVTAVDKILPSHIDSMTLQDEAKTPITDYIYTLEEGNKTAELKIPASDIVNNIGVAITLQDSPVPCSYAVLTETEGTRVAPSSAAEGVDYKGEIFVTADNKILPDHLDSVSFDDEESTPITDYTYAKESDKTANILIPAHNITDNIKISLTLLDPPMPPKWLVSFNSDGGSFVKSQKVLDGYHASKPLNPTKKIGDFKYNFGGWYKEGEDTPFNFDLTPITSDIILKAKWTDAPPTFSYRFKFNGVDCMIGGTDRYETDVLADAKVQFAIVPKATYLLPPNDEEHFNIITTKPENVTYDPATGVISISKMEADIEIMAISPKEDSYTFDFQGTGCTISNVAHYTKRWVSKGSNLSFTILPNKGYTLPTFGILEEIKLIGDNVTYDDETGIITVTDMSSDVTIIANAPMNTTVTYKISFDSRYFKANTIDDPNTALHQLVVERDSDIDSLKLYIYPEETFAMPDSITVTFDDGEALEGDYYYDKDEQIVIIYRKANALISIESTEIKRRITFDAGSGTFGSTGTNKVSFSIKEGINIAAFIRFIIQPTLKDNTFAYYTYDDGSSISYSDTLIGDTILKANYFNITTPYTNLDNIDWSIIKQVSVTNSNPGQCFQAGATKKVTINNKTHEVRIIGFNHDRLAANSQNAGITFEFANLISNSTGGPVNEMWDGDPSYRNYNYFRGELHNALKKNNYIYNMLPDEIKEIMETVIKKACISEDEGKTYVAASYEIELFPLSIHEFTDITCPESQIEGTKYEYYETHTSDADRIKKDANGTAQQYWTRSATSISIAGAHFCNYNGTFTYDGINRVHSIAPAFCI